MPSERGTDEHEAGEAGTSERVAGEAEPRGTRRRREQRPPTDYYGIPPIHRAHWGGLIEWYFFLGGLASGTYVVAAIAALFGRPEHIMVVRIGRYLAPLLVVPCPVLLILDLGRPERFYNMLRVVKLRSPMSLGTWGLVGFSLLAFLSGGQQAGRDGLLGGAGRVLGRLPARVLAALGVPFGFFLGGYTGVLLGATAVPLWARNARLLGPLFLSSAVSSSCALIQLVLACLPGRHEESESALERGELVAALSEAAALAAIHVHSGALDAPLTTGRLGRLHAFGAIGCGIVGPLLVRSAGRWLGLPPRPRSILASALALVGAFLVKHVMMRAGAQSADDPAATFRFARRDGVPDAAAVSGATSGTPAQSGYQPPTDAARA